MKAYKYSSEATEAIYLIENVYGWWVYQKDGRWARYSRGENNPDHFGTGQIPRPSDVFRSKLEKVKLLELLINTGLSERRGSLLGLPSSGVVHTTPFRTYSSIRKRER